MTASARKKHIQIVGVPMDLGAGRRGVGMGPSAIRIANVSQHLRALGYEVIDDGDVAVPSPESRSHGPENCRYLPEIYHVCNRLRMRVARIVAAGGVPLVLGGDHSIAIGTVGGIAEHYRASGQNIGLIWVDAHADMNTPESSPSGNVHGMPLAVLLGLGHERLVEMGGFWPKVPRENVCLIGIRNLDEHEKEIVRSSGVHAYTMRQIDERGMNAVMSEAIEHACRATAGFHLSFDLDGMDPSDTPGVGTPVKGGIDWREANLLAELAADSQRLLGVEITELNPVLDVRNQSGEVAVDIIVSAFGKSIL
ncbi:MAG: arginase [Planctomycetota bacterium]